MPIGTGGIVGFGYTGAVLERTLDALGLRQRVTAHNVANVNTPDFKPSTVPFEAALAEALRRDEVSGARSAQSAPQTPIQVAVNEKARTRANGNGVDIDEEMVTLAKTQIAYHAITLQWSGLYNRLRMAVREGRG